MDEENVQGQWVIIPLGILLQGTYEQWEKRWLPILVTLSGCLGDVSNKQISNAELLILVTLASTIRYMRYEQSSKGERITSSIISKARKLQW